MGGENPGQGTDPDTSLGIGAAAMSARIAFGLIGGTVQIYFAGHATHFVRGENKEDYQ